MLNIQHLESLAPFTTWRIGGPAEFLAEPKNEMEVKEVLEWANHKAVPFQIIGAGSNLLINDSGLEGLSICMRKMQGTIIDSSHGLIEALAGDSMPTLSRKAAKLGLHGFEWAIGIPGTVGGAAAMNAGAQGGCTAERLESVLVISEDNKKPFRLLRKDLDFSYRNSLIQKENLTVLSARFKLETGHPQKEILDTTLANLNHRTSTQPYQLPSCGSVFRNPEPLKAGKLIEDTGLKGLQLGGAEISNLHANFIVNTGKAKASDIKGLIQLIQKKVEAAHQIFLQPEVKQLGF